VKSDSRLLMVPLFAGLMAIGAPALSQTAAPSGGGWQDGHYVTQQVPGVNQNMRNLYLLRCATCHGANGQGTATGDYPQTGPALRGNPFVQNAPADALIRVIRLGREGPQRLYHETFPNMPAWGPEAVPDVDALVVFLKTDLQK